MVLKLKTNATSRHEDLLRVLLFLRFMVVLYDLVSNCNSSYRVFFLPHLYPHPTPTPPPKRCSSGRISVDVIKPLNRRKRRDWC